MGDQSVAGVGKGHPQRRPLAGSREESRSGVGRGEAVNPVLGEKCETAADFLFVGRVNFLGIAEIDREGLAGVGQGEGAGLGLA